MAVKKEAKPKSQIKSKTRVADHGEVFTSEREVNAMLDLVKSESERIESRFLEPACGDGNFLTEVLRRKLAIVTARYKRSPSEWEQMAVLAISSLYGVDILMDNVLECRNRLFKQWDKEYKKVCKKECTDDCRKSVQFILRHNILCGDALDMCQSTGDPIIFAQWDITKDAFGRCLAKRLDYRLDVLLAVNDEAQQMQLGLSDINEYLEYDATVDAMMPKPIKAFTPIEYWRIHEQEET